MQMYVDHRAKRGYLGLGTGTVCTGSSNLLIGPASTFASRFFLLYVQETRHIIVRKPTKCVSDGESRKEREYTAAIQCTD